ncbi:uncharacterized protein MELLADRAFT_91252 [Melampsora larici-populina 98AG31]|uniref:Uncharacterized protein n=1 Tax=Melampsora larici-populina (strain 98AG31 / pathotype 3-4-7) TaxID=747676 RepID=F4SEH8_MELLP|nr:uncharacterized protein MELLADRAFT_91252 [Melampsora larici-populina 98AG31]EGF96948.1 hypothetical protein MELLADRAFT_91252 [Melampsora larici-populina 98AG31]
MKIYTIDDSFLFTTMVDNVQWQIEILDTAGQEEYRGLWVEHAISQGDAFVVTYAINSIGSFNAVPSFLEIIKNAKKNSTSQLRDPPAVSNMRPKDYPFPFVVAGNKSDLTDSRQVAEDTGYKLADAAGGMFLECSAKENINIQELFAGLVRSIVWLRQKQNALGRDPTNMYEQFIPNIGYQSSKAVQSQSATTELRLTGEESAGSQKKQTDVQKTSGESEGPPKWPCNCNVV